MLTRKLKKHVKQFHTTFNLKPMTQLTPTRKIKRTDTKRRRSVVEEKRQRMSEGHVISNSVLPITPRVQQQTQPLSEEELRRSFDEWMKIVADNVALFFN